MDIRRKPNVISNHYLLKEGGRLIKGKFKLSTDLLSSSVGKKYFIKVNILRLGVCKGGLTVEFGGR